MGKRRSTTEQWKQRIVEALSTSEIPLSVDNVRITAGLTNWESTKALLLELVLEKKISGTRTSSGWIFSKLLVQ